MGANPFLYEMTPIEMGSNNENYRIASPESVPIHLTRKIFLKNGNYRNCFKVIQCSDASKTWRWDVLKWPVCQNF